MARDPSIKKLPGYGKPVKRTSGKSIAEMEAIGAAGTKKDKKKLLVKFLGGKGAPNLKDWQRKEIEKGHSGVFWDKKKYDWAFSRIPGKHPEVPTAVPGAKSKYLHDVARLQKASTGQRVERDVGEALAYTGIPGLGGLLGVVGGSVGPVKGASSLTRPIEAARRSQAAGKLAGRRRGAIDMGGPKKPTERGKGLSGIARKTRAKVVEIAEASKQREAAAAKRLRATTKSQAKRKAAERKKSKVASWEALKKKAKKEAGRRAKEQVLAKRIKARKIDRRRARGVPEWDKAKLQAKERTSRRKKREALAARKGTLPPWSFKKLKQDLARHEAKKKLPFRGQPVKRATDLPKSKPPSEIPKESREWLTPEDIRRVREDFVLGRGEAKGLTQAERQEQIGQLNVMLTDAEKSVAKGGRGVPYSFDPESMTPQDIRIDRQMEAGGAHVVRESGIPRAKKTDSEITREVFPSAPPAKQMEYPLQAKMDDELDRIFHEFDIGKLTKREADAEVMMWREEKQKWIDNLAPETTSTPPTYFPHFPTEPTASDVARAAGSPTSLPPLPTNSDVARAARARGGSTEVSESMWARDYPSAPPAQRGGIDIDAVDRALIPPAIPVTTAPLPTGGPKPGWQHGPGRPHMDGDPGIETILRRARLAREAAEERAKNFPELDLARAQPPRPPPRAIPVTEPPHTPAGGRGTEIPTADEARFFREARSWDTTEGFQPYTSPGVLAARKAAATALAAGTGVTIGAAPMLIPSRIDEPEFVPQRRKTPAEIEAMDRPAPRAPSPERSGEWRFVPRGTLDKKKAAKAAKAVPSGATAKKKKSLDTKRQVKKYPPKEK